MKFIEELDLKGKRVLLRADLNVPLDAARNITDDSRIKGVVPTISSVIERGGIPVVMSHLGDGTDRPDPMFSLAPIGVRLGQLLGSPVIMAPDCIGQKVVDLTKNAQPGQTILLENLRFHAGEKKNDPAFAQQLSFMGDVYVNDAFATAHRAHASVGGVPALFKQKAAGLLVQKELAFYERALLKPKRPLCVILGGAKVSTKLNLLLAIAQKADKIIIGGAMANTFLAAQGLQIGKSLCERDLFGKVIELMAAAARRDCKLYLPVDLTVGPSIDATGLSRAVPSFEIPADLMALDIGPATSLLFKEALVSAETILWNGPMGAFEVEEYSRGTHQLIEAIASSHALKVVGGGDTDAAIHQMELAHKFDFISTGGGAFLALLEGKPLPAFVALDN